METMTTERRRLVKRYVVARSEGEGLRLEQLMSKLRRAVQEVREEEPELLDYQLYDLTFALREGGMLVQMEFRK
ncbi:hypothetical protein [Tumebacillus lipolyticus]|uniref:Uncharacterized protein n=1 Tax=Tumebacillus lipolyticus TaxID=1280370 RepID=A0ABW4ZT85_9BACL